MADVTTTPGPPAALARIDPRLLGSATAAGGRFWRLAICRCPGQRV